VQLSCKLANLVGYGDRVHTAVSIRCPDSLPTVMAAQAAGDCTLEEAAEWLEE
jgi:hypothetical protein